MEFVRITLRIRTVQKFLIRSVVQCQEEHSVQVVSFADVNMFKGMRDLNFLCTIVALYGGHAALVTPQRNVLVQLYDSTAGDTWTYDPKGAIRNTPIVPWNVYNASSDPCADKWSGVFCFNSSAAPCVDNNSGECFVVQLVLEYFNMTGSLLDGQFTNLTTLVEVSSILFFLRWFAVI